MDLLRAISHWPNIQQWYIPSSASSTWRGAPLPEALFVLSVLTVLRRLLIGACDLIIDSAPMCLVGDRFP
jgi:hypothetical protein